MNRWFYSQTIRLLSPVLLAWMALRARRAGGDPQVFAGERFGRYESASPLKKPVWVHAVSLGETRAATPFVQALLDKGEPVLLTHFTATGWAEGAGSLTSACSGVWMRTVINKRTTSVRIRSSMSENNSKASTRHCPVRAIPASAPS